MKKSKFTDQQIAFALQQAEGGTPVEGVCRDGPKMLPYSPVRTPISLWSIASWQQLRQRGRVPVVPA